MPAAGTRQHQESEAHSGLTTRIPAKLRTQIKIYCLEHDLDMRDFIAEALKEKLASLRKGATNAE